MSEEPTLSLEELGEVKTVRVYNQAYVDKQQERIKTLEKRCANYEMTISKVEKGTCDICKETEKDKKIVDLEKKNAELKAYNEKLLDGDIEKHNKIVELQAQIEKMKCCKICRHYKWGSCNYHSLWVKDCKENGMKLFELKEK